MGFGAPVPTSSGRPKMPSLSSTASSSMSTLQSESMSSLYRYPPTRQDSRATILKRGWHPSSVVRQRSVKFSDTVEVLDFDKEKIVSTLGDTSAEIP